MYWVYILYSRDQFTTIGTRENVSRYCNLKFLMSSKITKIMKKYTILESYNLESILELILDSYGFVTKNKTCYWSVVKGEKIRSEVLYVVPR